MHAEGCIHKQICLAGSAGGCLILLLCAALISVCIPPFIIQQIEKDKWSPVEFRRINLIPLCVLPNDNNANRTCTKTSAHNKYPLLFPDWHWKLLCTGISSERWWVEIFACYNAQHFGGNNAAVVETIMTWIWQSIQSTMFATRFYNIISWL